MRNISYIAILTLLAATHAVHAADKLSADEIVAKANDASYYAGKDGSAHVKMSIKDKSGSTRTREFTILRLNTKDTKQKFYVYFTAPADVRKMAYLVWKNPGGNDDRWLWLPAKGLVKRIAPGDKRTSFVGSDFLYEDVSGRDLKADTHELTETTDTQYKIRNTPTTKGSVAFSHYDVWIDKDTYLPRKAEYFDKKGKLYRKVEGVKVEKIEGYPTITEALVTDLAGGSTTRNTFSKIKYDIGLKESIFSERFLRRPPREVTR
jgi:hypothetical protein